MTKEHKYRLLRYDAALPFLIFSFVNIKSLSSAIWVILSTLLFALIYISIVRDYFKQWHRLGWILLLSYIFYYVTQLDPNYFWYFFFPTNLLVYKYNAGWLSPRFISFHLVLLFSFVLIVFNNTYSTLDKWEILIFPVFIYLVTYMSQRDYQARFLRAQLMEKNQTINLLSAENERNRIGRDLHDTLGHTFAMMTLKTELALKQMDKGNQEAIQKELRELNQISRDSMRNVRNLVSDLKYRTVTEELNYIADMFSPSDIELAIDNSLDTDKLSPLIQSSMTMILRELTTNIVKHADASHCQITLYRDQKLIIQVQDDGVGFTQVIGDELRSIKERLQLVKGQVEILSSQNPTLVRVILEERVMSL